MKTLRAEIRGGDEKPTLHANLRIEIWDETEKKRRALKMAGYCWLGAVVTVLIPIVHFVLPPALLIAGPVVYFRLRKQKGIIHESEIPCPECGKTAKVPKSPLALPLETLCPHCQSRILVAETATA